MTLAYRWNEKRLRAFKSKIMDNVLAYLDGKINYRYTKDQQKILEELTYYLYHYKLPTEDIIQILIIVEEAKFKKAAKTVEKYLSHEDEWIRKLSLRALTMGFKLKKHTITSINFFLKDPDIECRGEGISSLGSLYFNTRNKKITKLLFAEFKKRRCESPENDYIRSSIYDALLNIYGIGGVARENLETYKDQKIYLHKLIKNPNNAKKEYIRRLENIRKKIKKSSKK